MCSSLTPTTACVSLMEPPRVRIWAAFIQFVGSDEGQKIIREYGKQQYGEAVYNKKKYAKKYEH